MSHTPGPWKVDKNHKGFVDIRRDVDSYTSDIATVWDFYAENYESNASLIAAAPDMLKALEWYGWKVDEGRKNTLEGDRARYDLDRDGGSRAYAVIKKARGEE